MTAIIPGSLRVSTVRKLKAPHVREVYKKHLASLGYSKKTVKLRLMMTESFFAYLKRTSGPEDLREVEREHIKGYVRHLQTLVSVRTGRPLADKTRQMMLCTVRQLFSCLYTQELILTNPGEDIHLKREKQAQRRAVLSKEEMATLLDSMDGCSYASLRDRAMFELMYSSGLRVGEAVSLEMADIDFESRMVLVKGKWGKDRVVPVGEVAVEYLKSYLKRRWQARGDQVFIGQWGKLIPSNVNQFFKKWAGKAGVMRKNLTVHSIRHSVATHLLENGADIRYVQELLGHESIETTVIYTHCQYESLRRVYKTYHPRENEYFKEVGNEYLKRLYAFKARLEKRKALQAKRRKKGGNSLTEREDYL
ncbi:Tyrosine recombinase XerC [subsurface metagenome]